MRIRFLPLILAIFVVAACDDNLGVEPWDPTPVPFALYSASRPDLIGFPSAFDFVNLRPVEIETPGTNGGWDIVLATQGNQLVLLPVGAFEGQVSRAAIATISGQTFNSLTEAPADTARFTMQPVPVTAGGVYVVRTRRFACSFSTASNYAKLEAVTVDVALGFATFQVVRNPLCNDRSFVPPEN